LKRRLLIISCFILYAAIIILPPFIHHYIYPNLSDDTANLLLNMSHGLQNLNYAGSLYLYYPLSLISNVIHSSLYHVWMWFNLLILIPVGVVLYFIGSKLSDWKTGLLMLLIPIFVSYGILSYSIMGVIYSEILVAILMPVLIYFVTKYLLEKRAYQLIISIVLGAFTCTFHPSGLYVPMVAFTALVVYLIYKLVRRDFTDIRYYFKMSAIIIGFIIFNLVMIKLISPNTWVQIGSLLDSIFKHQSITKYSLPILEWIMTFVTLPIIIILGVSIYIILKDKIALSKQLRLYLYFMACWLVVLLVLGYGMLSIAPDRAEVDMASVIGIVTALLLGVSLKAKDKTTGKVNSIKITASSGLSKDEVEKIQNSSYCSINLISLIFILNSLLVISFPFIL